MFLSLPIYTFELNKVSDRLISYNRVFRAVVAGGIPGKRIGANWFADADAIPAAAEMLSSTSYPAKAHGAYASAAAKRARRAARETGAV